MLVQSHKPEEIKSFNGDVSSSASNGMDGAQDGSFLYGKTAIKHEIERATERTTALVIGKTHFTQ